ncbi:MAG: ribbon-helix-helix protein, CopG family [Pyrinomonadaceae bacterium]
MKVKTSITLSEQVVEAIDRLAGKSNNRSKFIEAALDSYIVQRERDEQHKRDLEIINRRSRRLNREAEDVLSFQGKW